MAFNRSENLNDETFLPVPAAKQLSKKVIASHYSQMRQVICCAALDRMQPSETQSRSLVPAAH